MSRTFLGLASWRGVSCGLILVTLRLAWKWYCLRREGSAIQARCDEVLAVARDSLRKCDERAARLERELSQLREEMVSMQAHARNEREAAKQECLTMLTRAQEDVANMRLELHSVRAARELADFQAQAKQVWPFSDRAQAAHSVAGGPTSPNPGQGCAPLPHTSCMCCCGRLGVWTPGQLTDAFVFPGQTICDTGVKLSPQGEEIVGAALTAVANCAWLFCHCTHIHYDTY